MDDNLTKDVFLGINAINLTCLRPGYRVIKLREAGTLNWLENSLLFVHISISDI
jgi:hypothetical protein